VLETAAREGRFEAEGWRVRKDGNRFWANVVIDAIRDESGTLIGFAKVTRDLTERRNAERDLEAAREQLVQSQKMEAIGQLTGGVAHDFNNLLTVIVGGADILSRLIGDNERARRILGNMQYAAERGASLTGHLLAFARRQALVPRMIETQELLEGISGLLRRSLQGNVTLELGVPNDIWPTVADQNQLELAILNVGLNARDAMPHGGRIRIEARNEVRHDGDYVAIAISDTGEGIPEEIKDKVLEPFFTTKGVGKGSGLGLSQAYGFAIQSGGALSIDSAVGKGTTVTLHLPAAKAASAHGEKEDPIRAPIKGSGTILLVEDDPVVADFVSGLLEDAGFTVTVVYEARTAFDRLQGGEQFDLVFSDIIMPGGMNGMELAYRVRAAKPTQPILLSTGYIEESVSQDVSAFPLIRKPYRADELTGVIADLIKEAKAA
jgi:signal transduction histidine kinase/CheY-like chemotaxis protein